MENSNQQLHVAFFPFMTPGHSIPMLDLVRLFIARGVKTTVFTTPLNAPNIAKYLNIVETSSHFSYNNNSIDKSIYVTSFPSKEAGLPEGIESQDSTTSPEMTLKFFVAMELLKDPLDEFLKDVKPNCLVADNFFPYATEVASKYGIPRLVFQFTGFFPMSMMMALRFHPENSVSSDEEQFVVPSLPHEIKLTKSQLQPEFEGKDKINSALSRLCGGAGRALFTSYGVIFNSFYDLEPDYVEYYKNTMGSRSRVWHMGPVSLCNRHEDGKLKSMRGMSASISDHLCLNWLNAKESNSVVYVCFGSLTCFSEEQLKEIATALERFDRNFIWVLKGGKGNEEWLPQGFEEKIEGKGLIIRGWAPQVLILDHEAIGGFVTHCGWNSTLESISAGVPMVTWPIYAEQFYNEKLVTDVLKVGVQVGSIHWSETTGGTFLSHEKIKVALNRIMVEEEGMEMRNRAKKLKEMAYKAVDEEGSSYCHLSSLINELTRCMKI